MADQNVAETALAAGKEIALKQILGAQAKDLVPFIIDDHGNAKSVEHLLPTPLRRRAKVTMHDALSLIEYVIRYGTEDSVIFASKQTHTFVAVLDYHRAVETDHGAEAPAIAKTAAGWCDHQATLKLVLTEDWKRWIGKNKVAMNQTEFAQFLEDNIPNIAKPVGAEIVEMAKSLEATKHVTFASSIRLDNGERQFVYEEEIQGMSKKGTMAVPERFTLGLAPFEGSGLYELDARFRYRIDAQGKLTMWYDLLRPEFVLDDAFRVERDKIKAGVPNDVPMLAGSADCKPLP